MIVRKVTCPTCGNDTRVNNTKEEQKCEFCRRPISVKFEMGKAKGRSHWKVIVEALPFERNFKRPNQNRGYKIKSVSKYREEDIYGKV